MNNTGSQEERDKLLNRDTSGEEAMESIDQAQEDSVGEVADLMKTDKVEVVPGRQTADPEKEQQAAPEPTERIAVQKPEFQELTSSGTLSSPRNLDLIMDVPLEFSVVLGESQKTIRDILELGAGSVVELDKMTDEPLEIYVNGKLIAEGEVVVINESFGIRITNILSREQRIRHLK